MSLSGCSWQAIDLRPSGTNYARFSQLARVAINKWRGECTRHTYAQYVYAISSSRQAICVSRHHTQRRAMTKQNSTQHSTKHTQSNSNSSSCQSKSKSSQKHRKTYQKAVGDGDARNSNALGGSDCQFELRYSCNFLEYTINKEQDKTLSQKSLKSCWSNN